MTVIEELRVLSENATSVFNEALLLSKLSDVFVVDIQARVSQDVFGFEARDVYTFAIHYLDHGKKFTCIKDELIFKNLVDRARAVIHAHENRKVSDASAPSELANRFIYHEPKDGQPDIYRQIREKAHELANLFEQLVPDCSERVKAIDKVDEAVMWANAGVARHG